LKKTILICTVVAALCGILAYADSGANIAREILAMERQAMEGWLQGNPDPALAILDPEVTYFHVPLEKRLDGLPAVRAFFELYRGKPLFDKYEMLEPKVQVSGDVAILTYQLAIQNGSVASRWNSTEVYKHKKEGWRVIHAHWSRVSTPQPAPPRQ